jgi:hypothetical protein
MGIPGFSHIRSTIFAVVYMIMNMYGTVTIVFDKLYGGCRGRDLSFSYTVWQFVLIAWGFYQLVGLPNSGAVGFATMIDAIAKARNAWSTVVALMATLAILAFVILEILVVQRAHAYQRVSASPDDDVARVEPLVPHSGGS